MSGKRSRSVFAGVAAPPPPPPGLLPSPPPLRDITREVRRGENAAPSFPSAKVHARGAASPCHGALSGSVTGGEEGPATPRKILSPSDPPPPCEIYRPVDDPGPGNDENSAPAPPTGFPRAEAPTAGDLEAPSAGDTSRSERASKSPRPRRRAPLEWRCSRPPRYFPDPAVVSPPTRQTKLFLPFGLSNARLGARINSVDAFWWRQLFPIARPRRQSSSLRPMVKSFVSKEEDIFGVLDDNNLPVPPFCCVFNNVLMDGRYLVVTDENGTVRILTTMSYDGRSDDRDVKASWIAHDNAIFDVSWSADDKTLLTGAGDQTVRSWDVETQQCVAMFRGHSSSVKSISFNVTDPNVFASGGRDGNILIWDVRCAGVATVLVGLRLHKPADAIPNAHGWNSQEPYRKRKKRVSTLIPPRHTASQSVTAVKFLHHNPSVLASAGSSSEAIKYWDIRSYGSHAFKDRPLPVQSSEPITTSKRPHGVTSLSLDSRGTRLFASSKRSIYMYDAHKLGKPQRTFTSPSYDCSSFYIRTTVSPDDCFIASGSADDLIHIWEVDGPDPGNSIRLGGHNGEVTGVSWSKRRFDVLASCSDDRRVRLWRADREAAEYLSWARSQPNGSTAINIPECGGAIAESDQEERSMGSSEVGSDSSRRDNDRGIRPDPARPWRMPPAL